MTISFVLIRLAAVFLFVRAVQGLSSFSYLLTGDAPVATFAAVTLVFSVMLPAAIAIVLWTHPEKVSGAQALGSEQNGPITASQILMIGVTLIGLYVLIYGIVDLFRIETEALLQRKMAQAADLPFAAWTRTAIQSRVAYGVQIVLGITLILGREGITRLVLKAKYSGIANAKPADDSQPKTGV